MASLLSLIPPWLRRLAFPTFLSTVILLSFIIVRHFQVTSRRCPRRRPKHGLPATNPLRHDEQPPGSGGSDRGSSSLVSGARAPGDFLVFVLGSGGHTKEMLMMMDDGFCDMRGLHRRYLVSSGDALSRHQVSEYEEGLARLCSRRGRDSDKDTDREGGKDRYSDREPGTHDIMTVSRARRVHQPFWSAPLTTLLSILDIAPALLRPRPGPRPGTPARFPSTIFSNGPGTGFTVALAVHFMKLFYVVPEDCMRFVYIESWARTSTLSLTGKMLYHMGLTDVFVTQHQEVADRYGLCNAGEMVFNARRDDLDRAPLR